MDLKSVYEIANKINEAILVDSLSKDALADAEVHIKALPSQLYAIDRELYRLAHEGSTEGFVHTGKIKAVIDKVTFIFETKINEEEQIKQ